MASKQIRVGQLIAPFGPGSIYTDRTGTPHVVAGLDFWFMEWDESEGKMIQCPSRSEFEISEPRLTELLRVNRLCVPPDFRYVQRGFVAPPNAGLYVPALRFPRWYRATKKGHLRKMPDYARRIERPEDGGRYQPVRFVSICAAGHLNEFPWKEWIGCECANDGDLILTDMGGSELTSVKVRCGSCPKGSDGEKGRNIGGTTVKPNVEQGEQSAFQKKGISCPGGRPWLGADACQTGCVEPLVGALINQTNLYSARTISALSLPDLTIEDSEVAKLKGSIQDSGVILGLVKTLWQLNSRKGAISLTQSSLEESESIFNPELIEAALDSLFNPNVGLNLSDAAVPAAPESELLSFRRAEFNVIRKGVDDPDLAKELRVKEVNTPDELKVWISRVSLIEKLRETRAFFGFDRLENNSDPLENMPNSAVEQLFRNIPHEHEMWLPAVKTFGEGLFFEFSEKAISDWQTANMQELQYRLDDRFIGNVASVYKTLPPLAGADILWASRYLLVHSMAHCLINQLVFECGYSTASLRERLFVSADSASPMAGILIYTSAGDSEGTLGGLVRLGYPERFAPVFRRAILQASWCSADPICSENLGGTGSQLANKAACHGCILLPETSCETINHGLDRSLLVGTPECRQLGFFSNLLEI